MNNTLRVFFVIHQRKSGTNNYLKLRTHSDFSEKTPEEAYESLYQKHGRFHMNERTQRAPDEWVEINSHTYVDLRRERVLLESERVIEQPLFDPVTLQRCISYAPGKKPRK